MLTVTLEEVRVIRIDGKKAEWKITKPCDVVTVDGDVFVGGAPGCNHGLGSLVAFDNDKNPAHMPKNLHTHCCPTALGWRR